MGKGRIISAQGEGRYTLELLEDRTRAESQRARAVEKISEIDSRITELEQDEADAQQAVDTAASEQDAAIEQYQDAVAAEKVSVKAAKALLDEAENTLAQATSDRDTIASNLDDRRQDQQAAETKVEQANQDYLDAKATYEATLEDEDATAEEQQAAYDKMVEAEDALLLAEDELAVVNEDILLLEEDLAVAQDEVDAATEDVARATTDYEAAQENERINEEARATMVEAGEAVVQGAAKRDAIRRQIRLLEAQKLAAQARVERIDALPPLRQIDAWCADYTEDLSGEVATAEVPGEVGQVVIKPGFEGADQWSASEDGAIQPALSGTPASVFYNLAMMPGWQRWRPTFRIATISNIGNDLCSISLDVATSSQQGLNVNAQGSYTGVPIMYMDCNGDAFEDGDRVLVAFSGNTDQPMVVGFEQEPRACLDISFNFPIANITSENVSSWRWGYEGGYPPDNAYRVNGYEDDRHHMLGIADFQIHALKEKISSESVGASGKTEISVRVEIETVDSGYTSGVSSVSEGFSEEKKRIICELSSGDLYADFGIEIHSRATLEHYFVAANWYQPPGDYPVARVINQECSVKINHGSSSTAIGLVDKDILFSRCLYTISTYDSVDPAIDSYDSFAPTRLFDIPGHIRVYRGAGGFYAVIGLKYLVIGDVVGSSYLSPPDFATPSASQGYITFRIDTDGGVQLVENQNGEPGLF